MEQVTCNCFLAKIIKEMIVYIISTRNFIGKPIPLGSVLKRFRHGSNAMLPLPVGMV